MSPPPGAALALLLQRVGTRIPSEDADELRWYFSSSGIAAFQSSDMGRQWERAELYASRGEPCTSCGGDPTSGRQGSGFVHADAGKQKLATAASKLTNAQLQKLALLEIKLEPALGNRVCGRCKGFGFVARPIRRAQTAITARPTGSSVRTSTPGSVEMGEISVLRLGRVVRQLDAVAERDAGSVDVLAAFFGPEGGSRLAVYPLTPAGKTLLRRNKLRVLPVKFLQNELAAERKRSDAQRKALFAAAEEQATELLHTAGRAWNSVHHPPAAPNQKIAELLALIDRARTAFEPSSLRLPRQRSYGPRSG